VRNFEGDISYLMLTLSLPYRGLLYHDISVAHASKIFLIEALKTHYIPFDVGVASRSPNSASRIDSLSPQVFGRGDQLRGLDSLFVSQSLETIRYYIDPRYNAHRFYQTEVNVPDWEMRQLSSPQQSQADHFLPAPTFHRQTLAPTPTPSLSGSIHSTDVTREFASEISPRQLSH
jgi:hypothetical protein